MHLSVLTPNRSPFCNNMWSQGSIPGLCIHCASIRPMWSCLIKKPISKIIKAWKIDRSTASFWWTSQCAQKSTDKSLKQHVVQIVIRLLWAIKWLQRDLRETIQYRNRKSKLSKSVLTTEAIPTRSHHGCKPILPKQGSTTPVQFWAPGSTNARGTLGHDPKDESTTWWMNPRSSGKGNGRWITPMMPWISNMMIHCGKNRSIPPWHP